MTNVFLDKEDPLNFGSNPDTDSGSRPYSPWWTYAVSDCSCFHFQNYQTATNTRRNTLSVIINFYYTCCMASLRKVSTDRALTQRRIACRLGRRLACHQDLTVIPHLRTCYHCTVTKTSLFSTSILHQHVR